MRSVLLKILIIIAIIIFSFSGWKLYSIFHEYGEADKEYDSISEEYVKEKTTQDIEDPNDRWDVDFESLAGINEDIVAWIEFPACSINYPVVQAEDNEYYLTHTFEKKDNKSGGIFLDMENKNDFSDHNSIIYGHNMKNGSMFGRLKKLYQETNLRSSNPYFYIILKDNTVLKYEIFSYYIDNYNSSAYSIPQTEEELETYIEYCKSHTIETISIPVDKDDKIVTLATCSGAAGSDKRFLVHGVLVD